MLCLRCKKEAPDSPFCPHCGKKQEVEPKSRRMRANGMGSVYRLPNGKYRAAVTLGYDNIGRRVYKTKSGFKTKKEAMAYLPMLKLDAEKPKDMKFSALYEEWKKIHFPTIGKSKQGSYITAYNKCTPIQYRNIADLRVKDIQAIIDADAGVYYPKHDIRVLCNLMFKYAMQNDYISKNYAQFVKLPPVPRSKRDAFSKVEISSIWEEYTHGNNIAGYILIMIYTGMRFGELQKIQKENIFLDENYMIGGIKTEAGIDREIIIADKIKPIISKFYESAKKYLLEMDEKVFYDKYYETLNRANARRLTPHCCRHTFATLMAESGIQPAIIQELAGHEDYQTTLQYTHISRIEKQKAINKI